MHKHLVVAVLFAGIALQAHAQVDQNAAQNSALPAPVAEPAEPNEPPANEPVTPDNAPVSDIAPPPADAEPPPEAVVEAAPPPPPVEPAPVASPAPASPSGPGVYNFRFTIFLNGRPIGSPGVMIAEGSEGAVEVGSRFGYKIDLSLTPNPRDAIFYRFGDKVAQASHEDAVYLNLAMALFGGPDDNNLERCIVLAPSLLISPNGKTNAVEQDISDAAARCSTPDRPLNSLKLNIVATPAQ